MSNTTSDDRLPPTRFLFRPAQPARLPLGFIGVPLTGRDTAGAVCGTDETKCPQGDWCCDTGDTCSFDNGAFFCCPPGAEGAGCARVCALGDFQCGSVCCADGQTCMGRDASSPYCVNTRPSSTFSSTLITSTRSSEASPTASLTRLSTFTSTRPSGTQLPSTTLVSATATATASGSATPTDLTAESGLPLSAQIAMGVVVPVVVVLLVAALWFCLFRKPARSRRTYSDDTGRTPPTPPPAYAKSGSGGIVVTTTTRGYTFSRARTPEGGDAGASAGHEMGRLTREEGRTVGLAVTTPVATPAPRDSGEVSPLGGRKGFM